MAATLPTPTRDKPRKINFTVASLKSLACPPDKPRLYVYDLRTPALAYCVTENDARSFYLYKRVDGKPERFKLGNANEITIEQARTLAAKRNGQIASGVNPCEEIRQRKHELTLGELWEWYRDHHAKPHKRSWKRDEQQYDDRLAHWSSRRLSSIKPGDVQELHTAIGADGGPYAANRAIEILRAMFNIAINKLEWHKPNPARSVEKFKESERERFLTADEMPRFFAALAEEPSQRMRDYFIVLLFTGQRKSNVAAMAWANLNLAAATWTIPAEQSKSGHAITVPLNPEVMEVLKRRHDERDEACPYVFPGQGKTGHLVDPKIPFQQLRKRAGLTDLRTHDLRRTLGSWQAAGGASLQIIGKSLGHHSERATRVYSRLQLDPVRESINAATAAMRLASVARKDGGK
jgi:integrase